jgi:hypothetical protein
MKPQARLTIYAVISAFALCVVIKPASATDRFTRWDTGQPRELINQPGCCILEDYSGPRRCDIGDQ